MWKMFRKKKDRPAPDDAAALQKKDGLTSYVLAFLWRRKWMILIISALGIGCTGFGTYVCIPEYKASVKILVKSGTDQKIAIFDTMQRPMLRGMNIIPANNVIEIATSETYGRSIVDEFGLAEVLRKRQEEPADFRETFWSDVTKAKKALKRAIKYPYTLYLKKVKGLQPKTKPTNYRRKAIRKFMGGMTDIELVAESDVIKLSVWWADPVESATMVRRLAEMVVEGFVAQQQAEARLGHDFSQREFLEAEAALKDAEEALHDFREQSGIQGLERQKELYIDQMHEAERNLMQTEAELASKRARLEEGQRQVDEQNRKLSSLGQYQALLDDSITLTVDIESLQAKRARYEEARAAAEQSLKQLSGVESGLRRLEREVSLRESLFVKLAQKRDELAIQGASRLSEFDLWVIDEPEITANIGADWPDWMLNLAIGIPGSIALALGLALLVHLWSDPFWARGDPVERE